MVKSVSRTRERETQRPERGYRYILQPWGSRHVLHVSYPIPWGDWKEEDPHVSRFTWWGYVTPKGEAVQRLHVGDDRRFPSIGHARLHLLEERLVEEHAEEVRRAKREAEEARRKRLKSVLRDFEREHGQ